MLHILHVEDDPALIKTFSRFFRIYFPDAMVTHETSARRAVECVKALQFDLILSDYDLAGDTAEDLIAFLKEKQPHMLDRMLLLSGRDKPVHQHRLIKPSSNEEIAAYLYILSSKNLNQ